MFHDTNAPRQTLVILFTFFVWSSVGVRCWFSVDAFVVVREVTRDTCGTPGKRVRFDHKTAIDKVDCVSLVCVERVELKQLGGKDWSG